MLNLRTAAEPWLIPSDYISNITWYDIILHPQIPKTHTCSQLKKKNTLAARFVMSRAIACHRHTVKPNHAWDQSWDIDLKLNWLAPWYGIGGCACGCFCCCWWFFHFGCCWLLLVVVCGWVLAVVLFTNSWWHQCQRKLPRLPPVGVLYQPSILAMINHLFEVSNGA